MSIKHQAVALFSGGLDSILSVLHMKAKGYFVKPIYFETPFFPANTAKEAAEKNQIELTVIDITDVHIEMLKNPRYGYGKNMNPCIDCHGLMFQKAAELMQELECDYLISGEVIGQRPMSQRRDAMNSVAKLSTAKDLLVRPLCQKLLPDSKPIREGWVKKEDMLDIQGRGRYRQIELAKEYKVESYSNPGGGCILTDEGFSKRLKDLFQHHSVNRKEIEWLKIGRHFRINEDVKIIIGRNHAENQAMQELITNEITMYCDAVPGPTGVILSKINLSIQIMEKAASIFLRYHSKLKAEATVFFFREGNLIDHIDIQKMEHENVQQLQI